jgi:uncharacterized protein (TIRG00374 family)
LERPTTRRYIEFALLCLLALVILWWFGRKLNWAEVRAALSQANWLLLAIAVGVISLVYLLRAFRWQAFLAPIVHARLSDLFAATTIGFSAVLIAGRAGEVVRPVILPMRDTRVRASASLVTIFIERIYDTVAVVFLFAVNLLWFQPSAGNGTDLSTLRLIGFFLLGSALAILIGLAWFRKHSERTEQLWGRLFEGRWFMPAIVNKVCISLLRQLSRALRVLVDARELAITVAWTAAVWFGIAFANLLVLRAFGLPFGARETLFVLGWALVGSLVPTPGGAAGAFHAATAAALLILGVEREMAAAVSIVMHLVDFGPAILFGFFYFIRGEINISRLRSLVSQDVSQESNDRLGAQDAVLERGL